MEPGRRFKLVLAPNSSLTWRQNLWVLASFVAVSLLVAVGMLLKGAWVILPFAGIELALLTFVLCNVQQRTRAREVIYIDERRIRIEKGLNTPQSCWSFCRPGVLIMVQPGGLVAAEQRICLCGDQGIIEVGEFLNPNDRARLVSDLAGCGLRAYRHSNWSSLSV